MMNTNCFKYLTIPIIATLLYVALALTEKLYALYLHDILITDPFARLIIWNSVIRIVLFSLVIFVPMLIFTSAYELTKLNFKTIIYAVFISIALFIFNIINHFFTSYVREVLNTYYDISYYHLVNFFSYYSMLYTLLTILVILGITLIYARLNKHSLAPITNKNIGLRYAGLFITLTLVESLQNINTVSILTEIPWKILFYFISITLASFVFYFAYCYLWTKEALHVNKITTNYAAKLVGSCLFTLFMLISICFALYMGILKLPQLLRHVNNPKELIQVLSIASYLFSFVLFFILLYRVPSSGYRYMHAGFYLCATIAQIVIIILNTPSYRLSFNNIASILGYTCGLLWFGLSVSLCLFYVCNKLSINLFFRNKNGLN